MKYHYVFFYSAYLLNFIRKEGSCPFSNGKAIKKVFHGTHNKKIALMTEFFIRKQRNGLFPWSNFES